MKHTRWLRVRIKNSTTGEEINLYHPPANGEDIDDYLRYSVLKLPAPRDSNIKIEALPSPADWLTALVPPIPSSAPIPSIPKSKKRKGR